MRHLLTLTALILSLCICGCSDKKSHVYDKPVTTLALSSSTVSCSGTVNASISTTNTNGKKVGIFYVLIRVVDGEDWVKEDIQYAEIDPNGTFSHTYPSVLNDRDDDTTITYQLYVSYMFNTYPDEEYDQSVLFLGCPPIHAN